MELLAVVEAVLLVEADGVDVSDVEVPEESEVDSDVASEVGSDVGFSSFLSGSSSGLLFGFAFGSTSPPSLFGLVCFGPQSHLMMAGHFGLDFEFDGRMGSGMWRPPPPPPPGLLPLGGGHGRSTTPPVPTKIGPVVVFEADSTYPVVIMVGAVKDL